MVGRDPNAHRYCLAALQGEWTENDAVSDRTSQPVLGIRSGWPKSDSMASVMLWVDLSQGLNKG